MKPIRTKAFNWAIKVTPFSPQTFGDQFYLEALWAKSNCNQNMFFSFILKCYLEELSAKTSLVPAATPHAAARHLHIIWLIGGFPDDIIWLRYVIFQFQPNLAVQNSSTCVKPHWTPLHGRCSCHLASHPQVVSSPSVNLTKKISRPFFVRIWEQGVVDIKDRDASFERAFVFPRFQNFAFNSCASLTSFDSATWVPWGIF